MGSALLRNLLGTYVSQDNPSTVNDPSAYMFVRNWSGKACHAYAYWTRPFPLGATITSAKLYLTFAPKPVSGTLSVTASRLKETAKFSKMTYNNRPTSIYPNSAAVGSLTGTWVGANTLEIDITAQMQAVSDGDKWYGYRLTSTWSNTAWSPKFASPQSVTPTHRPYVEIEWSDAPDVPTSLSPSGGHVVSTAQPIVRFNYTDVSGDTDLAGAQVQVSASSSFTAPMYDSGQQAVDSPQWDLTGSTFTAVDGTTYYWRCRVQDGAGLWSGWSAVTSFKYKPLPTVNLINPPDGADSSVGDPTPPIIWESAGQDYYGLALYGNNEGPAPVYRSLDFDLPLKKTVMQSAFRNEDTGEWYVTQVQAGTATGRETTIVSRLDAKGKYLDRMTLVDAGHGTHFALEPVGTDTYLWTQWRTYGTPTGPMTDRDIYRFKYTPGAVRHATDSGVTKKIDNALSTNMQVWNDQVNDRFVTSSGGNYRLYAFSDVQANGIPGATQIGVTLSGFGLDDTVQGNTVWQDILYRYSGTQSQSDTPMLRAYSFTTGDLLWEYDTSQVGGYTKGTAEPESVYVTAGAEGKPAIFVGWSEGSGSAGRQSSVYAMEVADIEAAAATWDPIKIWSLSKTKGTAQAYTLPKGKITRAGKYSIHVQAWDTEDREAVPNGRAYADVYRHFTFTSDPTVDGVATIEADPLDPLPGIHVIWTRDEAPDSFTILRDGDVMVSGINPADEDYEATVGELRWHWVDRFPIKGVAHVYQVQAVVNGQSSADNLKVTGTNAIRGTWILDDTEVGSQSITCQLVNDKERTMEFGEQSEIYEVLGSSTVSLVTQSMRGYQGQIQGEIRKVPGVDGSIGYWVRRMLALKSSPGRRVWLMLNGMTFPAVLQNVNVYPLPQADEAWAVSFQFYQQGALPYTVRV